MSPDLTVTTAAMGERPILANLLQLYIHDFSEYWSGTDQGELDDEGRFFEYPVDGYWREPGRIPLIFRLQGRPAGFALLNDKGHTDHPIDHNMAEFFVVRKHRGSGVGRAAAREIFSRYPGRWEVAVARRNVGALPFWRETITGNADVIDLEQLDVDNSAWNGALFRFRVKADPGRTPSP